jgi:two-component system chemotaxis response regulator CheY
MTAPAARSARILVVDDYLLTRDMVRSILIGLGFTRVATVENIAHAKIKLVDDTYDLVICDWNMPNGSGLELLQFLRSDPKYTKVPFIMLTAEAYRENVVEAMRAGVSEYISKPFTGQVLAEKIDLVLGNK